MSKKLFLFFFLITLIAIPLLSFATHVGGIVPCGAGESGHPACTTCHAFQLLHNVIQFGFLFILLPATAIAFLIGGVLMLTAGGNETQVTRAKSILWNTIIGILIAFSSWVIVNTIINTIAGGEVEFDTGTLQWYEFPGCEGFESPIDEDITSLVPPPSPPSSSGLRCSADRNSPQLDSLISCVSEGANAQGLTITSVISFQGRHACDLERNPPNISCHYGGTACNGVAHAVDFAIASSQRNPANWNKLRQIAANCPSSSARCEIGVAPFISDCSNPAVNHVHTNDSVACGCN